MTEAEAIQAFTQKCAKVNKEATAIIEEVRKYPDWFLMEGGSDGTYGHVLWHSQYGKLLPEIADLAEAFGGQV